MAPRREDYKTKDERSYPLWADINDAMSVIMPAYWSDARDRRKERGWMFRGQTNSEWGLIPSLYRPPLDDAVLKARKDYTDAFIDAFKKESPQFNLKHKAYNLPDRSDFNCDASYEEFLELVRKERPDLFDRTETFGAHTLFPPADPLLRFAETWKLEHPDPTKSTRSQSIKRSEIDGIPL